MMGPAGHGTPDSAITLADEWDAIRTVGRTNTITDFRSMAAEAGLSIVASARQANGQFLVECQPV